MNEDILAAARRERPPVGAKARVRRAVALSVAAGSVTAAASAAGKSGLSGVAVGKVAALAFALAAVGGAATLVNKKEAPKVAPVAEAPVPALETKAPPPVTDAPPAVQVPATRETVKRDTKATKRKTSVTLEPDGFGAAVTTLERAQKALAASEFAAAEKLAASVGSSPFLPEVLFVRAVASCGLVNERAAQTHLKALLALDPKLHTRAAAQCAQLNEKTPK